MDKYKVNPGSKLNLTTVFDTIQSLFSGNISKRFLKLFKTKGVLAGQTASTEFKASFNTNATPVVRLNIQAGTVLLANGDQITLTDVTSVAPLECGIHVANTEYALLIKYQSQGSEPFIAANGFYYDKTGESEYSTKYAKYSDSYKFVIKPFNSYSVFEDEYAICKFKTNTNNDGLDITVLADLRTILTIDNKLYSPLDVVLKDRDSTGSEKINGSIEVRDSIRANTSHTKTLFVTDSNNSNALEAEVVDGVAIIKAHQNNSSPLPIKFTDDENAPLLFIDSANKRIGINKLPGAYDLDIAGTLSVSGDIRSNGKIVGLKENEYIADSILNYRIDSITGQRNNYIHKGNVADITLDPDLRPLMALSFKTIMQDWSAPTKTTTKVAVTLKWGYEDLILTGIANANWGITGTASITGRTFIENSLIGYYIWLPGRRENLRIIANTANLLTLENEDGTIWHNSGFNETGVWLHSNADQYVVTSDKVFDAIEVGAPQTAISAASMSPTKQQITLELDPLTKYIFKIYGIKGKAKTAMAGLASGDVPMLIKHPNINSNGAKIGATPTANGFVVEITGWEAAEAYEVCWTTSSAGASFTDPAHARRITTERIVDIPTSSSVSYNVKVRPLICGQQVAQPLSTDVVSGSSGNLPQDQILVSPYIDFDTFAGDVVTSTSLYANVYALELTNIYRPYIGNNSDYPVNMSNSVVGELITINGHDYRIHNLHRKEDHALMVGYVYMEVELASKVTAAPISGVPFTIGVSKASRVVFRSNKLTIDYTISRIDVDCDVLRTASARPLTIRVYQQGRESTADTVIVSATDMPFTVDGDTQILGVHGDRNLIIDFVDPTDIASASPPHTYNALRLQESGFAGRITIYGRPKATQIHRTTSAL